MIDKWSEFGLGAQPIIPPSGLLRTLFRSIIKRVCLFQRTSDTGAGGGVQEPGILHCVGGATDAPVHLPRDCLTVPSRAADVAGECRSRRPGQLDGGPDVAVYTRYRFNCAETNPSKEPLGGRPRGICPVLSHTRPAATLPTREETTPDVA